ncbi:MAG: triose-phosphate isomerase [Burkholderiaceae bacterium]|nr:triose-phosphate isomerase [Burkholderiaceae bacterium]
MLDSVATQRRPWVVGNWKMNGSIVGNESLLSSLLGLMEAHGKKPIADCAVAVPAPFLFQAAVRLKGHGLGWGGQDVSEQQAGAFTGEISASMLQDFEAQFALVGHSERRARHGETDALVAAKAVRLAESGLTPVVCVGESLQTRDDGGALQFVCGQVQHVAQALHDKGMLTKAVFAYEPIWAIGTGRSASPEQAQEVHAAIRQTVAGVDAQAAASVRLLYGGSVKAATAAALYAQQDIDGALVGGAALVAQEFFDIACAMSDQ